MENNTNEPLVEQISDTEELTGLADNYPIILNGVEYKYFKTWSFTRNSTVYTHETEAGTQEDVTTRKGRRTIRGAVTCLQPLVAGLLALDNLDEFQAKVYDPLLDGYDTLNVRIAPSSMSYSLKEKSAKLKTTNGVWQVSFTLEEF